MLPDRSFVGLDIAAKTLDRARAECAGAGPTNLEFEEGDFNRLELESDSFQTILGLGAIHHVENLEEFWVACARALRSGGAVLAQEYIGPDRLQWTDEQRQAGDRALAEIVPMRHQPHHHTIEPTPIDAMLQLDPSEAVRSTEILPTCKAAGFAIDGYAGAGCALLQPVLMNQITTFDPRDWQHNLVLARLFAEEDRLTQQGVLGDDFASFVAVPPPG